MNKFSLLILAVAALASCSKATSPSVSIHQEPGDVSYEVIVHCYQGIEYFATHDEKHDDTSDQLTGASQELVALAAANAPNPSRDLIELFHKYDMDKNPHNEATDGKARWRTEIELIADYKLDFAQVLFKRLEGRQP